jgi:hypothetical protein
MGDKMSNMLDDPRMKTVTDSARPGSFKMKENASNPIPSVAFGDAPGGGAKGARTFGNSSIKKRGIFK